MGGPADGSRLSFALLGPHWCAAAAPPTAAPDGLPAAQGTTPADTPIALLVSTIAQLGENPAAPEGGLRGGSRCGGAPLRQPPARHGTAMHALWVRLTSAWGRHPWLRWHGPHRRRCTHPPPTALAASRHRAQAAAMAEAHQRVAEIYQASSKLAKFPFEPYWPEKKLRICITGAGGFIARCARWSRATRGAACTLLLVRVHTGWCLDWAVRCSDAVRTALTPPCPVLPPLSHLAKRLKSEGHYIVGCGEHGWVMQLIGGQLSAQVMRSTATPARSAF